MDIREIMDIMDIMDIIDIMIITAWGKKKGSLIPGSQHFPSLIGSEITQLLQGALVSSYSILGT